MSNAWRRLLGSLVGLGVIYGIVWVRDANGLEPLSQVAVDVARVTIGLFGLYAVACIIIATIETLRRR